MGVCLGLDMFDLNSEKPDRDKVRQCGSGAESRARGLGADQGLYKHIREQ